MSKERFDIDEVIRILNLEIRAEQADEGRDFDVACLIALNKLEKCKQYEDLDEQGLLLRLPVAVGDTVYFFSFGKVFSAEVVEIKYLCEAENYGKFTRQRITIDGEECGITIIDFSDIGKTYFHTQSEAEEKLRELEGK